MKTLYLLAHCLVASWLLVAFPAFAQQAGTAPSKLQETLAAAAEAGEFTFVVFHREDSDALRKMMQAAKEGADARPGKARATTAFVDSPANQELVKQFGIARAPMPMTVVVAPNGVATGLFARTLTQQQLVTAIVPPTMMRCMKELQNQKLVFVCLTRTEQVEVPASVRTIQKDPQFSERIALVPMRLDDPAETRFYQQMKLNSQKVNGAYAVLIAPPGVLVGHFDEQSTAAQITASLHASGKCCDDPNCKHGSAPQATRPATKSR